MGNVRATENVPATLPRVMGEESDMLSFRKKNIYLIHNSKLFFYFYLANQTFVSRKYLKGNETAMLPPSFFSVERIFKYFSGFYFF